MNGIARLFFGVVLAVAITPAAHAASSERLDDEATITVVEEGETPDAVVKVIELPAHAAAEAKTKSASGVDTANNAKDKTGSGREFGQQVSAEARSNAADQAHSDAADQARNDTRNDNAGGANRHGPH